MLKVNSQAQSLLLNNKDLKPKGSASTQEKGQEAQSSKIDELKQQVQNGEYRVDLDKTAQAMINEFVR